MVTNPVTALYTTLQLNTDFHALTGALHNLPVKSRSAAAIHCSAG